MGPSANRTLHIGRLAIVEWLSPNERKTGKELADAAAKWAKVEYYSCDSAQSVLGAIAGLARTSPEKGPPILHIEAHGERGQNGGIGPDADFSEFLSWQELREPLRQLNIATRFNLIVFGSACYGNGFLWEIARDLGPAAFVCCIGFVNSIKPTSLVAMTKEFYRAIFVDGMIVDDAIDSAQRQAFNPDVEVIAPRTIDHLLANSIRELVDGEWRNELDDISIHQACEMAVSGLLAYELFPENRERFPFDLDALLKR